MKKILFLGGAKSQLAAISAAKEMGYYTVLCDYLPDNPGRLVADEWHPASTTDYAAVLKVAEKCKVDGILTYGSDVAASTAAYVAEQMGLPGSPYESVYILTHKDRFRQFLRENGFHTPWSVGFSCNEKQKAIAFIKRKTLPVMVKPVDSQGAKGVCMVSVEEEIEPAIEYALSKSISKRVIVEEYIQRSGMQIGGDGFSIDGELVFAPFSNTYFMNTPGTEFIPVAECWPPVTPAGTLTQLHSELQRALRLLKMGTQAYNFEAVVDKAGELYIIEIGPRSGGSLVPLITEKMTGYKVTEAIVRAAAGDAVPPFDDCHIPGYWASRSICTEKTGVLKQLLIDPTFQKKNLQIMEQYVEPGETVAGMQSLSSSVAFVAARFDTRDEMTEFVEFPEKYIQVILSE